MKILIPIKENKGVESKLSEHFGHCPYFGIYETASKNTEIIENNIDHTNEQLTPVDQIMRFSPDIVFSKGIGERAIKLFSKTQIKLKTGEFQTLGEVIKNWENLKDLISGCGH